MKTSLIVVALVGPALAAGGASLAPGPTDSATVLLPAYTVTVPRLNAFEQALARSLDQLRSTARKPLPFKAEIPLLHAQNETRSKSVKAPRILNLANS